MGRFYFYPAVVLCMLFLMSLMACQSEPYDPSALNEQAGELEVVIPAEHYIMDASVSPSGTWLYYDYRTANDEYYASLLNIPENKWYDKIISGRSAAVWLDDDHLVTLGGVLQLSTMTASRKEPITVISIEEGASLLAEATDLFLSTRYGSLIFSTDPDYPYTISFSAYDLCNNNGVVKTPLECVYEMLSEEQRASLTVVPLPNGLPETPDYSPDGQYYIQKTPFRDDPTSGGVGVRLFKAGESTPLVYGHRYGWIEEFLGWAPDSSGAYVLYRPASPTLDLLRSEFPIRKFLVPGAAPRGAPTLVSPLPTIAGLEQQQSSTR